MPRDLTVENVLDDVSVEEERTHFILQQAKTHNPKTKS